MSSQNDYKDLIQETSEVFESFGPLLEKQAAADLRAVEVADSLVKHQFISIEKRASFCEKLKDPVFVLDYLEKIAEESSGPISLGEVTTSDGSGSSLGRPEDEFENGILGNRSY